VAVFTGQPLGAWHALPVSPLISGDALRFVFAPDQEKLYARIDARFEQMLNNGALEEVKDLRDRGLASVLPAMKALGVQELIRHLAGETDLESAASAAKTASRRYAKRQRTWLKTQMMSWKTLQTQEMEKFGDEIFTNICKSGLTPG
jgi:tRNA dimethylallyltransferase